MNRGVPLPLRHTRLGLASLTLAYFMQGLASIVVVGLAYPMSQDLGVAPESIARLVMVFSLAYAFTGTLLQPLLAPFSRTQRMLFGLALWTAGSLLAALAGSYELQVLARIMLGAAGSIIGPTASTLASLVVEPERRQRAVGSAYLGMTIALVAGLPATAQLGAIFGWREVFAGMSAIGAAALLLVFWLFPMGDARGDDRTRPRAKLDHLVPFALWSSVTTFLLLGGQMATYALIAVLLNDRFDAGADAVAATFLLYGIGGVIGNLIGSRSLGAAGVERVMKITILLVALLHVPMFLAPSHWVLAAVYFFVGAASLMFQTRMQSRLIETSGPRADLVMAINQSSMHLGMACGAFSGSLIVPTFGVTVLPMVSACVVGAGVLCFFISSRIKSTLAHPAP